MNNPESIPYEAYEPVDEAIDRAAALEVAKQAAYDAMDQDTFALADKLVAEGNTPEQVEEAFMEAAYPGELIGARNRVSVTQEFVWCNSKGKMHNITVVVGVVLHRGRLEWPVLESATGILRRALAGIDEWARKELGLEQDKSLFDGTVISAGRAIPKADYFASKDTIEKEYARCTNCAPGDPTASGFADVCLINECPECGNEKGWECDGKGNLSRVKTSERTEDELPIPDSPEWKPDYSITPRRVVCAANRYRKTGRIICGARHWDKVMRAQKLPDETWSGWDQGFIDQFGDFMTREEAYEVAINQFQFIRRCGPEGGRSLYSEHIY